MAKYKITFNWDYSEFEDYDEDINAEINYFDIANFGEDVQSESGIKDFEEYYNEDLTDDDKIHVDTIDIEYDDESCYVELSTDKALKNPKDFAKEFVQYMFDGLEYPYVSVNFTGTSYTMDWNYTHDGPYERKQTVDYDEKFDIDSYTDLQIEKID